MNASTRWEATCVSAAMDLCCTKTSTTARKVRKQRALPDGIWDFVPFGLHCSQGELVISVKIPFFECSNVKKKNTSVGAVLKDPRHAIGNLVLPEESALHTWVALG